MSDYTSVVFGVREVIWNVPITRLSFNTATACLYSAFLGLVTKVTWAGDVFFAESPLNTDTRIIRTLWHVPLVSVLTAFHCNCKKEQQTNGLSRESWEGYVSSCYPRVVCLR